MPELPEVETIKLGLQRKIVSLKIKDIQVLNPKSFQGEASQIIGSKVVSVFRRAKMLGIKLSNDLALLIHLKMSGQLILKQNSKKAEDRFVGGHPTQDMLGELPNKSTRVIFEFDNGSKLYFNDQRKFGWIKLIESKQEKLDNLFGKLGPEPLEKGFTQQILKERLLKRKNTAIKVVLLDQTIIAGIGNIYASEALFNAKIDPRIKVGSLTKDQLKRLHSGIIKALQDGVKYGGSTKTHFVDAEGKKGLFLDYAKVYFRDKKNCLNCSSTILKITLGGRGTFYCPNCQMS